MLNLPFGQIGEVVEQPRLQIRDAHQRLVIDADLVALKAAWKNPLSLG